MNIMNQKYKVHGRGEQTHAVLEHVAGIQYLAVAFGKYGFSWHHSSKIFVCTCFVLLMDPAWTQPSWIVTTPGYL